MAPEAIAVVWNVLGFSWATLDNKLASCLILRVFFSFRRSLVFGSWKNTVSLDGKCSFKLCVNIYAQIYIYYRQIVNTISAYNFFRILLFCSPLSFPMDLFTPQRSLIPAFHLQITCALLSHSLLFPHSFPPAMFLFSFPVFFNYSRLCT